MFWKKRDKTKEEKSYQEFFKDTTAILNYLTDGILVFDRNSRLSFINPQAESFSAVSKERILKKSILELNRFFLFRPLVSLLGGGIKEFFRKELQISKNFILEVTTVPIIVKEEKIGTLVILHDVTREKLVDKMKSEFVTLAAHQLRTPTSTVKWSLKGLIEGDLGEFTKEQKEAIEKTYKTNDKAIKLIDDLLNVSQIEEGKYLSKIVLSSIEEVIQVVVDAYKNEIKKRKLKFDFKKPKLPLPKVMLDITKMKIAIGNIFDNAIRYTPSGGRVSITYISNQEEIKVKVQDTGIGIPFYEQGKVFSKFFRGAKAMKIETEGTGLGLYIAKSIIEAHRGRIWFESGEGKGTTFYFTIPIKEEFGEFITEEFY